MSMKQHTQITPKVRREVYERDKECCIICGRPYPLETAHYISRAHGGKGIPENLVMLCKHCHMAYDGTEREAYGRCIKDYLMGQYPDWDEKSLIYDKYEWVKNET